ncbi:MAG: LysE family translocator [Phyllobacteriaceae bacterium]|nr:LysE family translocator [Phyllobacteriaceae bacterium]
MTLAALALFAGALFLNAGTPGPSVAALVAQVLTRGPRVVLPFLAAMWLGEAAWLAAAIGGLAVIAERLHEVFVAVKWAGVAYLLWLAWGLWRRPGEDAPAADEGVARGWRLFATGLSITVGNPKIMVFYVALLPTLVDISRIDLGAWAELTAVQIAVMAFVDLSWVGIAGRARRFLASPRALRLTRRVSAVAMGGAATAIAARA